MILNQTQIGVKDDTVSTSVPNNSIARLMYYLNSICTLVPIDDQGKFAKLRRYQNYLSLNQDEIDVLIQITALINPKVLLNNCLFVAPQLCGNFKNKFYQLSRVDNILGVSRNIIIGGQSKKVTKIMTCKPCWLQQNFYNPLSDIVESRKRSIQSRQRQITYNEVRVVKRKKCCSIM